VKEAFVVAVDAALALDDVSRADERTRSRHPSAGTVAAVPTGAFLPLPRSPGCLRRRRDGADRLFRRAAGLFRELGLPFYLAVTLLEHSEWIVGQGRRDDAAPLLDEARAIFGRMEAKPWLDRVDAVHAESPTAVLA
jgi:hypothetical protein